MIKISRLADYGMVIMSFLAAEPATRFSATQVAQCTRVPLPTVSKLLKIFNDSGLVASMRGVNGGYQLVKSAAAINLADVIMAIDGKPAVTQCSDGSNVCQLDKTCHLRHNWQFINSMIFDVLQKFSLADMQKPLAMPLSYFPMNDRLKMSGDK